MYDFNNEVILKFLGTHLFASPDRNEAKRAESGSGAGRVAQSYEGPLRCKAVAVLRSGQYTEHPHCALAPGQHLLRLPAGGHQPHLHAGAVPQDEEERRYVIVAVPFGRWLVDVSCFEPNMIKKNV